MANVDPTYSGNTSKLFPEIPPVHFEIMEDYSSGYTKKDIAVRKGISRQAVARMLKECSDVFECESVEHVRVVYLNRRLKYFPL
ncbi:hypothetical protein DAI21_22400 (plasmid) [Lelliottia sp. WB101]|jgi:hypothetical protein|uniref:hypothetical protein n=1 Tax=Lelliottia sp. WB101 TaxID=2153385 RepID=UPI000D224DA7|nr:hypothetical protein [Lelliottia sp. WB101]AVZ00387.1 hypothetical protein DAI21_22400 [Lelliottia sp. WB101]